MQNFRQKAVQVFTARLGLNTRAVPQIAVPFQRRNSLWQQVPGAETQKTNFGLAVANNGTVSIWIAGAGNVLYVTAIILSSSVAGQFLLQYNATNIARFLLAASVPFSINLGPGAYLYPAAGTLLIQNLTGGAADVYGNAWGAEVLA